MRGNARTQKPHTSKTSLESMQFVFLVHFKLFLTFNMMQNILIILTWRLRQKSKLVPMARLLFVSPYNN
jgi:hypothetical protein